MPWLASCHCPLDGCNGRSADVDPLTQEGQLVGALYTCHSCGGSYMESYERHTGITLDGIEPEG
jgi:hypothetical protein